MKKEMFEITVNEGKEGHARIRVQGERLTYKGFEDYTIFIHKDLEDGRFYNVSELSTGCTIYRHCQFKRIAIKEAQNVLEKVGREEFDRTVKYYQEKFA